MNLKKKFSMPFFPCLSFIIICQFQIGKKKKPCTTYLHLTIIVHRLSTQLKKNTKCKEKNKSMCEGPTNKSTKIPKYFQNFLVSKRGSFGQISNQNGHKNYGQGIRVCFAKHTLSKHNLGRLGLKPRPGPLFFFFLGWIQPNPHGCAGPNQTSLVTGSDQ